MEDRIKPEAKRELNIKMSMVSANFTLRADT